MKVILIDVKKEKKEEEEKTNIIDMTSRQTGICRNLSANDSNL